jgi:hypothetical protein
LVAEERKSHSHDHAHSLILLCPLGPRHRRSGN